MEVGSELRQQNPKCGVCRQIQFILTDYIDAEFTRILPTYDAFNLEFLGLYAFVGLKGIVNMTCLSKGVWFGVVFSTRSRMGIISKRKLVVVFLKYFQLFFIQSFVVYGRHNLTAVHARSGSHRCKFEEAHDVFLV